MEEPRLERLAANERQLREVNRRIETLTSDLREEGFAREREEAEFFCACGRPDCQERLRLTIAEYERVHMQSHRFIIVPGHETDPVERIVEHHDEYLVVEKKPDYQQPDGK